MGETEEEAVVLFWLGEIHEEMQIRTKKGRAIVIALPFFNAVDCS